MRHSIHRGQSTKVQKCVPGTSVTISGERTAILLFVQVRKLHATCWKLSSPVPWWSTSSSRRYLDLSCTAKSIQDSKCHPYFVPRAPLSPYREGKSVAVVSDAGTPVRPPPPWCKYCLPDRRAPSGIIGMSWVCGHTTAAMHGISTPPSPVPSLPIVSCLRPVSPLPEIV